MAVLVRRRLWVAAVLTVVVLGAALVGSFPARQILGQRRATADAVGRTAALDAQIGQLQQRIDALNEPDEIRRLAREKLDYAEPGQESYRVIFPPSGQVTVPRGWPFLLPDEPARPSGS